MCAIQHPRSISRNISKTTYIANTGGPKKKSLTLLVLRPLYFVLKRKSTNSANTGGPPCTTCYRNFRLRNSPSPSALPLPPPPPSASSFPPPFKGAGVQPTGLLPKPKTLIRVLPPTPPATRAFFPLYSTSTLPCRTVILLL
jgi:hypothetical protein